MLPNLICFQIFEGYLLYAEIKYSMLLKYSVWRTLLVTCREFSLNSSVSFMFIRHENKQWRNKPYKSFVFLIYSFCIALLYF